MVKISFLFFLVFLCSCSHSLVVAYGSGDGVFNAVELFHPRQAVEAVLPTPSESKNETKLSKESAGLFAPGKQPF